MIRTPNVVTRRPLHALVAALCPLLLLPPAAVTAADDAALAPAELVRLLADRYVAARFDAFPELAYFGLEDIAPADVHGRLGDNSAQALARGEDLEDELLARLHGVDSERLRAADPAAWLVYVSLRERLEASRGLRVCRHHLWNVSHLNGWQTLYARVAEAQPVDSVAAREAALARWSRFAQYLETRRGWLEQGLANGYSAPAAIVRRVLDQLDALLPPSPAASPLASFAVRSDDAEFRASALALVANDVLPAVAAYRDWLREAYLPAARPSLGVSALPDGERCYAAWLRDQTGLAIDAQEMFDLGQRLVAENRRAVEALGREHYGTDDFGAVLSRNNRAPGNRFRSLAEMLDYTRATVHRARDAVAPMFERLPSQAVVVEPYPAYLQGSGQSSRYERSADPGTPAVFRLDTDGWETVTRGSAEILAAHEVWPGHHLQIASAAAIGDLHPVLRLTASTAYLEGWGRYAESLAEEAGVYRAPFASITRRAWPARGMVVDPGLHALGWSREQAAAFLRESGRFAGAEAHAMIDRIAVLPGQLTAYDSGAQEIMSLREEAQRVLGAAFTLPDFHRVVLETGPVPLPTLSARVRAWLAATAAPGGTSAPPAPAPAATVSE